MPGGGVVLQERGVARLSHGKAVVLGVMLPQQAAAQAIKAGVLGHGHQFGVAFDRDVPGKLLGGHLFQHHAALPGDGPAAVQLLLHRLLPVRLAEHKHGFVQHRPLDPGGQRPGCLRGGFVPLLRQQIAPVPGHRAHPRQLARGGHLVGQRGHNPLLHGLHGQGDLALRQGRRAGLAGLHADGQGFQRWIVHPAARHKADAVFLKARQRRVQRTADHIAGSRRAARLPGHIRVAEPVQLFLQSGLVGHKRRDVQSHFMVVLGGNKFGLHTFPPIFPPAGGCARR